MVQSFRVGQEHAIAFDGGEARPGVGERLADDVIRVTVDDEELGARRATVDGVPTTSIARTPTRWGEDLVLTLARPLARRTFAPHARHAPRSGEIAWDEACARVAETALLVDVAGIREGEGWWLFPTFEIGCRAILIDKRGGRARRLGTGVALDDWIWAHEARLLHEDDAPSASIEIVDVRDADAATALLGDLSIGQHDADRRALLASLPARVAVRWSDLRALRRAAAAIAWRPASPER